MKLTEKSQIILDYIKANGKVATTELANALDKAPRSINANITDLCKKGLAVRSKVADGDKEVTYVELTAEGKSFVPTED